MPQRKDHSQREAFEDPFERCRIPNESQPFHGFVGRSVPNQACDKKDPCEIPPTRNGPKGTGKRNEPCSGGGSGAAAEGRSNGTGPEVEPASEKPGWSGTGDRAAFHRGILPEVLGEVLQCTGNPTMRYGGSYSRHTSYCYSDINIDVVTDRPVTPAQRERILDKLQTRRSQSKQCRQFFGNAEFYLEQFAINVSIPKMSGTRAVGVDEYIVIFQNRQDWCDEALMYPTLRGSVDRLEADRSLFEFYHGNTGAQNVARLIKYATYNIEDKFPGTIIECITKRVANSQFQQESGDSTSPPAITHAEALGHFDDAADYGAEYITLQKGEIVELLDPPHGEHIDEDWSYGKAGVRLGWFPTQFIKRIPPASSAHTGVSGDGIKVWCQEHQHELYRTVVHEISLGTDSTILNTMIDDVAHGVDPAKEERTAKIINTMSEFYQDEENREYVFIKRSPAKTWTQWDFIGNAAMCVPPHLPHQHSTGIPASAETGSAASRGTQSTKGNGKGRTGKSARAVSASIETVLEYVLVPGSAADFAGLVDNGIPNI